MGGQLELFHPGGEPVDLEARAEVIRFVAELQREVLELFARKGLLPGLEHLQSGRAHHGR
jgi:hypothetical protein